MTPLSAPPLASYLGWWRWLVAASLGLMAFGLVLVLAPGFTRQGFSLLIYASAGAIDEFGPAPVAYFTLLHAVLGAVTLGWGVLILWVVQGPFRRGLKEAWQMLAVSVVAWFVPDTAFSLWSGFWQNAALNLGFLALFAVPLGATYRVFHSGRS